MRSLADWLSQDNRQPPVTGNDGAPPPPLETVPSAVDVSRLTQDAFERGERHGQALAGATWEKRFEEQETAFAELRRADREVFEASFAAQCLAHLEEGLQKIQSEIEAAVCRVLRPFLEESAIARSQEAFQQTLLGELRRQSSSLVSAAIPDVLRPAVERASQDRGGLLELIRPEGPTCRATAVEGGFETSIRAWLDEIRVEQP